MQSVPSTVYVLRQLDALVGGEFYVNDHIDVPAHHLDVMMARAHGISIVVLYRDDKDRIVAHETFDKVIYAAKVETFRLSSTYSSLSLEATGSLLDWFAKGDPDLHGLFLALASLKKRIETSNIEGPSYRIEQEVAAEVTDSETSTPCESPAYFDDTTAHVLCIPRRSHTFYEPSSIYEAFTLPEPSVPYETPDPSTSHQAPDLSTPYEDYPLNESPILNGPATPHNPPSPRRTSLPVENLSPYVGLSPYLGLSTNKNPSPHAGPSSDDETSEPEIAFSIRTVSAYTFTPPRRRSLFPYALRPTASPDDSPPHRPNPHRRKSYLDRLLHPDPGPPSSSWTPDPMMMIPPLILDAEPQQPPSPPPPPKRPSLFKRASAKIRTSMPRSISGRLSGAYWYPGISVAAKSKRVIE